MYSGRYKCTKLIDSWSVPLQNIRKKAKSVGLFITKQLNTIGDQVLAERRLNKKALATTQSDNRARSESSDFDIIIAR